MNTEAMGLTWAMTLVAMSAGAGCMLAGLLIGMKIALRLSGWNRPLLAKEEPVKPEVTK